MRKLGQRVLSVLLVMTFIVVMLPMKSDAASYEYALFPMKTLTVSGGLHCYAMDFTGSGPSETAFAPFTGTIVDVLPTNGRRDKTDPGNTIVFQSDSEVYWADGSHAFMTISFTHEDNLSRFKVGQRYAQGAANFYKQGTAGMATGTHVHINVAKGRYAGWQQIQPGYYRTGEWRGEGWRLVNSVLPFDALFLKHDTVVWNDGKSTIQGISWKWLTAAQTEPTKPASAPTAVSVSPATAGIGDTITLSWNGINNSEAYYEYSVNGGSWTRASSGVKFTKTDAAGTYSFLVRARNDAGEGPSSSAVTAVVKENVNVTFLDWDDTVLETKKVKWGGDATLPSTVPTRRHYTFKGYLPQYGELKVTEDRILRADYQQNSYTVKFFGADGKQLNKTALILSGERAEPPEPPEITDYTFVGWSTQEFESVEKDLEVHATYVWSNFEIPIQTEIISAVKDKDDYKINVELTNHHDEEVKRGRIIVAIKTAAGKLVESTIIPFPAIAPNGGVYTDTITVYTPNLGSVVEVSVIGVQGDGNSSAPLSTTVSRAIDLGSPWSGWSPVLPPAGAVDTETGIEYRTRTKLIETGSVQSRPGWELVSTTAAPDTKWSDWSPYIPQSWTKYSEISVGGIKTREVGTATLYRYHYFRCANDHRHTHWGVSCPSCGAWIPESSWVEVWITTSHASMGITGTANGKRVTTAIDGRPYYFVLNDATTPGNRYRDRSIIYTYTHEQWQPWSEWAVGTPPIATGTKEVEQRPVYRYKSNDLEDTFYNYKRYRFENLRTGQIMYDYTSAWADSMGFPGEWEESKTSAEMPLLRVTPEGIYEYGNSQENKWFKANINNEGNKTVYITMESREDTSGTPYSVSGQLANAPEKKATLFVYHGTNVDPTANQIVHIAQTTLDEEGNYSFDFIPKFPVGHNGTGDFIVVLSLEGQTRPIYLTTIEALKPTHSVTFVQEDGTVIDTQRVIEGQSAILPEYPEKAGHNFIGWSCSVTNIRTDMTIVARYAKKEYTVVFINWNDEEFALRTFKHGDPLTVENLPTQFGGVFAGWYSPDGAIIDTVTENMVLTAKFNAASYTVNFYDADGNLLDTQIVTFGEEAITPDVSLTHEGLMFRYWNTTTDFVTQDMEIYPVYGFENTVETPVSDITSGIYYNTQTVTLSCATAGAQIWYIEHSDFDDDDMFDNLQNPFEFNEDGELTNGTLYTQPLEISADTLLYFIALKDGMNSSDLGISGYYFEEEEPVYGISLNSGLLKNFGTVNIGYEAQAAHSITVKNIGNRETGELAVSLSGTGAESFILNKNSINSIAADDSDSFTVVPKMGLAAGTYTAVVKVSGGADIAAQSFNVRFTVNPAVNTPKLVLSSRDAFVGQTLDVTISLENNPGIAIMNFAMKYDSSVLELVKITNGTVLNSPVHLTSAIQANPYIFNWSDYLAMENNTADGVIVTLQFRVLDEAAAGDTEITITPYSILNVNLQNVAFTTMNGILNIQSGLRGDVNGDGKVNAIDAAILSRVFATGWESWLESNGILVTNLGADGVAISLANGDICLGDVNGDGKINAVDAAILIRAFATGWETWLESNGILVTNLGADGIIIALANAA